MYNKSLHYFAIFVAACTFLLIFAGGLVTSTGSGLSVPDWPTTYGENMFTFPLHKWTGGIQFEHGHRLIASAVGFLTLILSFWLWKKDERKMMRVFGFYTLGAVLLQGLLGGLTVLYLLPAPISVGHAMLAQTFFCFTASIALFTSQWWKEELTLILPTKGFTILWLMIGVTVVVFIQLMFGSLMRHTYSGLVVPDFPLAFGQIFPSLSSDAVARYNATLIEQGVRHTADTPIATYQILVHLLHRSWAYVVTALVIVSSIKIIRAKFLPERIRDLGYKLLELVLLQFALGAFTVLTHKSVIITTLHVAIGSLVLVVSVLITLHLLKIFGFKFEKKDFVG